MRFLLRVQVENKKGFLLETAGSSNGWLIANDEHLQIPFSAYFIMHIRVTKM